MILSWGNTMLTQTDELRFKQHKINAYIDQWHSSHVQAELGICTGITIISGHFTATELSLGTKNNMLMNYKSAKNHAYTLNSKFLRKLCFEKTCIIRAVMRNIHMQQVILSATSHVFTGKGSKSKLFNLTLMNKLMRIEWVSEWVNDRVPFECLQKPMARLRRPWAKNGRHQPKCPTRWLRIIIYCCWKETFVIRFWFGLLLWAEEHRTRHQNGIGKRVTWSLIYDKYTR